jgi:polysaccharide export outer membrane protein
MNKKKTLILGCLAIILCGVLIAGNALSQTAKYRLQPTDVLNITIHDQPDLTTRTRVTTDGYITFPLLGKVSVVGLTVQDLEGKLKRLLERDYLVTAQVLVFIEAYHPRQVSVIGEVTLPGKYDMPEEKDMTLLEAIAMAGGFTKDALLKNIKIMRVNAGNQETITVDVRDITIRNMKEKDVVIHPDDVVVVPESFF